ncbi:MAG: hypothetical protein IT340_20040 [Chloroflexi bacterium]|nr:hypothetical protein [Chloroflexota bacterium]
MNYATGFGGQRFAPGAAAAAFGAFTDPTRISLNADDGRAAGFEAWLRALDTNFGSREALRRLREQISTNYELQSIGNPSQTWLEYLASLDPNRALLSQPSAQRGYQPARFQRAGTRVMTF